MDSICRICMNNTDDEHSTYIFKMEDNIATALFLISGVKVNIKVYKNTQGLTVKFSFRSWS